MNNLIAKFYPTLRQTHIQKNMQLEILEIRFGRIINVLFEHDHAENVFTLFGILIWKCSKCSCVSHCFRLVEQKLELCVSWEKPILLKESGVE